MMRNYKIPFFQETGFYSESLERKSLKYRFLLSQQESNTYNR